MIRSIHGIDGLLPMPVLALGTWRVGGNDCVQSVATALKAGYNKIDTAAIYRNEEQVRSGIELSLVRREDVFITSKLAPRDMESEQAAYNACLASLKRLNTNYLDLYLVHWPGPGGVDSQSPENESKRAAVWRAMERLYEEKKCLAIGVSNYLISHLQQLAKTAKHTPAVNQCELHPLCYQAQVPLIDYCAAHGIIFESYSTLGQGLDQVMNHPTLLAISKHRPSATKAQILLRWALQHGMDVLPKSITPSRIIENANLFSNDQDLNGVVNGAKAGCPHSDEESKRSLLSEVNGVAPLSCCEVKLIDHMSSVDVRFCWDPKPIK